MPGGNNVSRVDVSEVATGLGVFTVSGVVALGFSCGYGFVASIFKEHAQNRATSKNAPKGKNIDFAVPGFIRSPDISPNSLSKDKNIPAKTGIICSYVKNA
jgi:hypothetical protein